MRKCRVPLIASALAVLVLVATLLVNSGFFVEAHAVSATNQVGGTTGTWVYTLSNGTATKVYSTSTGLTGEVTVPDSLDGYTVTSVGGGTNSTQVVSKSLTTVTSVKLPSTVTSIEANAFYNCTGLTSINIPSSVTSIGMYAYRGCSALTTINIPSSITSIGTYAFAYCTKLSSASLPDTITTISAGMFSGDTLLASVNIPNSVVSIADYAFQSCYVLNNVNIDNVTSIGKYAFSGCYVLNNINIDNVTSINSYAFQDCKAIDKLSFGSELVSVEDNAYAGCIGLKEVNFNGTCLTLGNSIFTSCSIDNINVNGDLKLGYSTYMPFKGTTIKSLNINSSITGSAIFNGSYLESVVINSDVASLGTSLFYNCTKLTSVTFNSNKIQSLVQTFSGCTSLASVQLPDGITSLENTFSGCKKLTSMTIPDGVVSLYYTFSGCSLLTDVSIPNSVTDMNSTFYNCTSLTSVILPNSIPNLKYTFYGCTKLASIDIPDSVTSLNNTFYGCTLLKSVNMPDSVTTIGSEVFSYCTSFSATNPLVLSKNITSIGSGSFTSVKGVYYYSSNAVETSASKFYTGSYAWTAIDSSDMQIELASSKNESGYTITSTVTNGTAVTMKYANSYTGAINGTEFTDSFNVSNPGTYYVYAVDTNGKVKTASITLSSDVTPPTIHLSYSINGTDATITAVTSDESTVTTKWATTEEAASTGTEFTGSFVTTAGTYYVYAVDSAGNSSIASIVVTIDTTDPVISLKGTLADDSESVTVTANITEDSSYVTKWASGVQDESYFKSGNGTVFDGSFVATANGSYTVYAVDAYGNDVATTFVISQIVADTTPPTLSLTVSTTDITNQDVVITANASDEHSITTKYSSGDHNSAYFATAGTVFTDNFTVSSNGTYSVYAVDVAGNSTVAKVDVSNIYKDKPEISFDIATSTKKGSDITVKTDVSSSIAKTTKWAPGSQSESYFETAGTEFTDSFDITSGGMYTVYAKDAAGNVSTKTLNVSMIDIYAPTIGISMSQSKTNKPIVVTVDITDDDLDVVVNTLGVLNSQNSIMEQIPLSDSTVTTKWASGEQTEDYFVSGGTEFTGSFTVSENGTYTVYAEDAAGNKSVKTFTVNNIDKTAPTLTLQQLPTEITNSDVSIVATAVDDGTVTTKYSTDLAGASTGTVFSGSFKVSENGTYYVYAVDDAGNGVTASIVVSNIDKTAPVLSDTTTVSSDNGSATVKMNSSETTAVTKWAAGDQPLSYFVAGGTEFTGTFTVQHNGVYTVYARDTAGNETVYNVVVSNIDETSPVVELTKTPSTATAGDVTVTANVSDSSTYLTYYSKNATDKDAGTLFSNSFTVSQNGTYYVYAVDSANNSMLESIAISNIDRDAPVLSVSTSNKELTNQDVTITASVTDYSSVTTKYSTSLTGAATGTVFTDSFNAKANGTYYVYAVDEAGNNVTTSIDVNNIDKTGPSVSLALSTSDPAKSVTITANTDSDDCVATKYAFGDQASSYFQAGGTEFTGTFTADKNGVYTVAAFDALGNITTAKITVSNIDTEAPVVDPPKTDPSDNGGETTVTPGDSNEHLALCKWAYGDHDLAYFQGGEGTEFTDSFVATKNGTYTLYFRDDAGNETLQTVVISDIDETAPSLTLSASTDDLTNQPVIITAKAVDEHTVTTRYSTTEDGASTGTIFTNTFSVDSNGTYYVCATDTAGNSTVKSIAITNIDNTAPTLTISKSPESATVGNVTISVKAEDENGYTLKYSSDPSTASTGTEFTGSFDVNDNGTYYIYAVDSVGNNTTKAVTVSNIDRTAPSISATIDNMSLTTKVVVTANVTDNSTVVTKYAKGSCNESYFLTEGTEFNGSFTVTENGTYTIYAIDSAGNASTYSVVLNNIDSTPPTLSLVATPTEATSGKVTIVADAYDEYGVTTKYSTSETASVNGTTFENSFEVDSNGTYYVCATDLAGNNTVRSIKISNIQTIVTPPSDGGDDVNVVTPSTVYLTKWAYGQQAVEYFKDSGITFTGSFKATQNGYYTVYTLYKTGDETVTVIEVGTETGPEYAPVITLSQNPTDNTTGVVTISATVESSKSITTRYSMSSASASSGTEFTGSFNVSYNGIYYVYAVDTDGNSSIAYIVVSNIKGKNSGSTNSTGIQDIGSAGSDSNQIPITFDNEPTVFKARIPVQLPVSIDEYGKVSTASNAYITNESSYGCIQVNSIDVTNNNAWALTDHSIDFSQQRVNSKLYSLEINDNWVDQNSGKIELGTTSGKALNIGDSLNIMYDIHVPPQTGLVKETICNVIFTVGWYK